MNTGISSMFFGDMRATELFSLLGKHPGAKVIDLWYDTPFHLLQDVPARPAVVSMVRRELAKLGLEVVTHAAAFDVDPIAYSPAMQRHTLAETQASIEFASALKAKFVTVHGGFSSFGSRVSSYDLVLFERFIVELLDFIEKKKLDVTLCLENDAATEAMIRPLESLHILENMLDKNPQVYMTLDVSHVIKTTAMEDTFVVREPRVGVAALPAFLKEHGARVRVVHLSCPNKYRTHGRIDVVRNDLFFTTIREVSRHVHVASTPCIFEYTLVEFPGPGETMESIIADAAALSKKMQWD